MKDILMQAAAAVYRFFCVKPFRRMCYVALLFPVALIGYLSSGLDRRTMVFASRKSASPWIEERLLPREKAPEAALARYVEEVLLGPSSVDALPLFDSGVKLLTAMVRGGTAYVDLSDSAVFQVRGGPGTAESLEILRLGILRNFPAVKSVHIFIAGKEPFGANFGPAGQVGREKK